MTESPAPTSPTLADVRARQAETRARFRAQFEEEAREHMEKGEVWICGNWIQEGAADRVNRCLIRRARQVHIETLVGLAVLLLVALLTWVLLCFILSPYPPNPRARLPAAPAQSL